jgi:hypothetical protein
MVFSTPSNGISDTDMAFHCKLSLKTANGLSHKFREGMVRQRNSLILSGRVQMDGSFYAGVVRPANLKANRRNRRRQQKESGKQRCVIALVETRRNGRSVALAALNESADVVVPIARRFLSKGARVRTDDNGAYNRVSTYFEHKTVSHRKGFFLKGRHTNNVESFFKRMRGLQGVYHRVGRNLDAYAAEASWRANYARAPADKRLFQLLQLVLTKAETSRWRGCRQRGANRKAMPEVLWGPKLPTKN